MPPKLISQIKTSPRTFTIGIVGSRRICQLLRTQVDAAVFATTIAEERTIQIVVDAGNCFGKHMLRRATGLRKVFPNLNVIALTTPATYKSYFNARERNAIKNCTRLFSCADEIMLFKGRFSIGTIAEQHRMMAESCNIIFDGYTAKDARMSDDLARAIVGKEVKQVILANFVPAEIRYLTSVCRRVGIPEPGQMAEKE